jgi:hypothetical protein
VREVAAQDLTARWRRLNRHHIHIHTTTTPLSAAASTQRDAPEAEQPNIRAAINHCACDRALLLSLPIGKAPQRQSQPATSQICLAGEHLVEQKRALLST